MEALRAIDAWGARTAAGGVARADGVVATHGPRETELPWASVTKLLTGLAVLVALEEGTVDLDEPAGPPGSTLRHLLSHASGLPVDGEEPIAEPGRRRIYSNTGIELAARLLEERAEMPFADYFAGAVAGRSASPAGFAARRRTATAARSTTSSRSAASCCYRRSSRPRRSPRRRPSSSRASTGVLPGLGRMEPNDWGLTFELRDAKSPHWTGTRNSPRTFGHFGASGTFLWVDPDAGVACGVLTDRPFGDWAKEAWPALSDAVLAEL